MGINKELITFALIIILVNTILLIPLVSAETYKQNDCITLYKVCENCSYYNISSVNYPNTTKALTGQQMTKTGTLYSYSFCNTSALGEYHINYAYDLDGKVEVEQQTITVTTSGQELSTGQGLLYSIFLIAVIGLWCLITYGAIMIPNYNPRNEEGKLLSVSDLKYIKFLFIGLSYVFFWIITFLLKGIAENYLYFKGFMGFFNFLHSVTFAFMFPFVIGLILFSAIQWIVDLKLIKALERGVERI